jgi:hypothetical protein
MINETTNFSSPVTVKDANNNDVQVAYLNATLDTGNQNFNIGMSVNNKALVQANAATVKQQYDDFMAAVSARATELGYVIF